MSDNEEPPSKVSKMEMNAEFLDESLEAGQEEWLSEDLLTDDDHIEQNTSINSDKQTITKNETKQTSKEQIFESNMENTLNSLDSTNNELKLKQGESKDQEILENDSDRTDAGMSDDGNDTDGLLRMLQDGNKKKKVMSKQKEKKQIEDESSDDNNVFEKTRVTRLSKARAQCPASKAVPEASDTDEKTRVTRLSKARAQRPASKAVPEASDTDEKTRVTRLSKARAQRPASKAVPEASDTDESQDEAATVQKMFKIRNVASKSTAKPLITDQQKLAIQKYIERRERMNRCAQNMNAQRNARIAQNSTPKPVTPTPSKLNVEAKTSPLHKSIPKTSPSTGTNVKVPNVPKPAVPNKPKSNPPRVNPLQGARPGPMSKDEETKDESEIKEDNEFVEEEDGFNDGLASNPDVASKQQPEKQNVRIMEPERMDEEVPTDEDSDDEGSYYDDEMPTSDSDDLEDWFTLDLRSERAGEYIPMLGENARSILTEEKRRVGNRLDELRKSVIALSDSAKQQAEQIREATNTLNELEALIKAT